MPQDLFEKLNRTCADIEKRLLKIGASLEGSRFPASHFYHPMSSQSLPFHRVAPSDLKSDRGRNSARSGSGAASAKEDAELIRLLSKYEERIKTLEEEKQSLVERLTLKDLEINGTHSRDSDLGRLQTENWELKNRVDRMQRRRFSSARFWGSWAANYRRQKKILDRCLKREDETAQKIVQISDQLVRAQGRIAFLEHPPQPGGPSGVV
jgi:hypothetical protein